MKIKQSTVDINEANVLGDLVWSGRIWLNSMSVRIE